MKKDVDVKFNAQPITFMDCLCLIFIILKLTHVINWSWWVVLAPIWATLLIVIIVLTILFIAGKL